jgi:hypothetical protein
VAQSGNVALVADHDAVGGGGGVGVHGVPPVVAPAVPGYAS